MIKGIYNILRSKFFSFGSSSISSRLLRIANNYEYDEHADLYPVLKNYRRHIRTLFVIGTPPIRSLNIQLRSSIDKWEVLSKSILFIFLLFPSLVLAQDARKHLREGNRAYKQGELEDAGTQYQKALELDPQDKKAAFNLGDALYRQEKYAEAAQQFEMAADRIEDDAERAKAWHNHGNALLQAREFGKSVEAYKNALKADPTDEDTRYNLAYAQQMLQQQQQQQEQEQEQDEEKKDEEKEDQEKQDKEGDEDEEKKDQDEQGDQDPKDQDPKDNKEQPADPQRISKEDAERLLNALNNEEKNVQDKVKKKQMKVGTVKVEKDW